MRTLAEYLEVALDEGGKVVLMRIGSEVCAVCIVDPTGSYSAPAWHGTIELTLFDELLRLTKPGINQFQIGDQPYRFIQRFTQIGHCGAVILAPARGWTQFDLEGVTPGWSPNLIPVPTKARAKSAIAVHRSATARTT